MKQQNQNLCNIMRRYFFRQAAWFGIGPMALASLMNDRLIVTSNTDSQIVSQHEKVRIESVKRHRRWQAQLDQTKFFDEVFSQQN